MKILLVDDNQLNREVLSGMINILFSEVKVEAYERATEALALDLDSYDLILSDISMPELDGFMFYDALKEKGYSSPIIAVTALTVDGDKDKILMHGFDDYISKPIDMDMLKVTLEKYI